MIEIRNLHKYFNRFKKNKLHVINDVSLKLPDKGLIALLGPSGSGKTTMLNLIGGLDKQTKGKLIINNKKISKRSLFKRDHVRSLNIGYIFQDYKLIDDDSVFDNVALSLKLLGVKNKKEIKKRVEFILDKVGILRYRYRPAGMLSGGERQRVGIARALVKDPDIILADEPTGNLDSKNTLEVMNIITRIAQDKLVILVTHEQNLAKFYADRVIEFYDGVIKSDYKNDKPDDLDYQIENKFYLKDFKNKTKVSEKNAEINIYSNEKTDVKIDIVVRNGNYYIKTYNNYLTEVIDENSSVEFIDEHYKKIKKKDINNNSFDAEDIKKKRYSSIFNIFTLFINGFKKVFNYSLFKKFLLGGFLISGGFILYAVSSYTAATTIKDEMFIKTSRDYIAISTKSNTVSKFKKIEKLDDTAYLIPGETGYRFNLKINSLYQFTDLYQIVSGMLTPLESVKESDLIYGRMPQNEYEIVIDNLLITNALSTGSSYKMVDIMSVKDMLNVYLTAEGFKDFKVVGITNKNEPCIYINKDLILPLLASKDNYSENAILSYNVNKDNLKIVRGREPRNDYEITVPNDYKDEYPLYHKIDVKVNKTKLTVVGYYKTFDYEYRFMANDNTLKYNYIDKTKGISVYKGKVSLYKENGYPAYNTYKFARKQYIKTNKDAVKSKLLVSAVIISISLIEAFLISRSSFLSKVKEVGTLRAIGVKRLDICKMFLGEAFAITTLASLPGIFGASYLLKKLSEVRHFKYIFIVNFKVVFISIFIVYMFNILVSLIPVINLIRKTPANILSRNDVD